MKLLGMSVRDQNLDLRTYGDDTLQPHRASGSELLCCCWLAAILTGCRFRELEGVRRKGGDLRTDI